MTVECQAKRTRRKPKRMGGDTGFGFHRVSVSGGIVVRDFLGGRGCSRQQEDLIPFPAIDEYRERVCGFAEINRLLVYSSEPL